MLFPKNWCLTENEIASIKKVTPKDAGALWKGCSHKTLVKLVSEELEKTRGAHESRFAVSVDQADIAGVFDLKTDKNRPIGQKLSFGFVSSNARRRALTFFYGTTVYGKTMEDRWGCVMGTLDPTKHSVRESLAESVKEAVEDFDRISEGIPEYVKELEETKIDRKDADHILMSACRTGPTRYRFQWSKLGQVQKELDKEKKPLTYWKLYTAFAKVVRSKVKDMRQLDVLNTFRLLLPV